MACDEIESQELEGTEGRRHPKGRENRGKEREVSYEYHTSYRRMGQK